MERKAFQDFESDLDNLQLFIEELSDLSSNIQYINEDLDRTVQQIDQQAGTASTYPLPDANQHESTTVAASKLFSAANKGGLRKIQRSANKNFAKHEIEEETKQ